MGKADVTDLLLSIVIINYRTPQLTINCVKSLISQLSGIACQIFVVDNCSGDDSIEKIKLWLRSNDPEGLTKLLSSTVNGGFSYGNNLGIKQTKAKFYLLVNSDALVKPGTIKILMDTALQFPAAGIISPRLESENGVPQVSCFRYHNPLSEFCDAAKTGFIDRILHRFRVSLEVTDLVSSPDWTSFACVLLRQEMIESIGLLDEGYFMYFEDAEYCFRARRGGWGIVHNPQAGVVHFRGGSSPVKENTRLKKRLPTYYYKSRTRFFYQLHGKLGLTAANLLWTSGRVVSKCRQFLGSKNKSAIDCQWKDIWINWLKPMDPYTHPDAKR